MVAQLLGQGVAFIQWDSLTTFRTGSCSYLMGQSSNFRISSGSYLTGQCSNFRTRRGFYFRGLSNSFYNRVALI